MAGATLTRHGQDNNTKKRAPPTKKRTSKSEPCGQRPQRNRGHPMAPPVGARWYLRPPSPPSPISLATYLLARSMQSCRCHGPPFASLLVPLAWPASPILSRSGLLPNPAATLRPPPSDLERSVASRPCWLKRVSLRVAASLLEALQCPIGRAPPPAAEISNTKSNVSRTLPNYREAKRGTLWHP